MQGKSSQVNARQRTWFQTLLAVCAVPKTVLQGEQEGWWQGWWVMVVVHVAEVVHTQQFQVAAVPQHARSQIVREAPPCMPEPCSDGHLLRTQPSIAKRGCLAPAIIQG